MSDWNSPFDRAEWMVRQMFADVAGQCEDAVQNAEQGAVAYAELVSRSPNSAAAPILLEEFGISGSTAVGHLAALREALEAPALAHDQSALNRVGNLEARLNGALRKMKATGSPDVPSVHQLRELWATRSARYNRAAADPQLLRSLMMQEAAERHRRLQLVMELIASEGIAENRKQGCYIATAVYGSYDAPQVLVLRKFRDERLAQTPAGRALVRAYYTVSPSLARRLTPESAPSRIVRVGLDRVVGGLARRQ